MKTDPASGRIAIGYAVVLCLASAGTGHAVANGLYPLLLPLVPTVCYAFYRLIAILHETKRRVNFMFNAIDNDDFNFRFHEEPGDTDDMLLNASLNRIREILIQTKVRIEERERYYQLIMECAQTGMITIDDAGSVYQINNEALRIFGLPRLTHIRQTEASAPEAYAVLREIAPGKRYRAKCQTEIGETNLALSCSEILLEGKRLRVVVVSDIDNYLSEVQTESWSKLTRILTHEIMNSLAPITSLSDALLHLEKPLDADVRRGLDTINATSRRLMAFVDNFRRYTRIPPPRKEPFEVRPWLERAVRLTVPAKIAVTLTVDPADTLLYADPMQAGQVVVNLLKNGCEAVAGRRDAKIEIASHIDAQENIVITIADNGGEIPAETVENIFTPFFTTKPEGSGIGLSVSRRIMQLHGGSLRLTGNTAGRVVFTLTFR